MCRWWVGYLPNAVTLLWFIHEVYEETVCAADAILGQEVHRPSLACISRCHSYSYTTESSSFLNCVLVRRSILWHNPRNSLPTMPTKISAKARKDFENRLKFRYGPRSAALALMLMKVWAKLDLATDPSMVMTVDRMILTGTEQELKEFRDARASICITAGVAVSLLRMMLPTTAHACPGCRFYTSDHHGVEFTADRLRPLVSKGSSGYRPLLRCFVCTCCGGAAGIVNELAGCKANPD